MLLLLFLFSCYSKYVSTILRVRCAGAVAEIGAEGRLQEAGRLLPADAWLPMPVFRISGKRPEGPTATSRSSATESDTVGA